MSVTDKIGQVLLYGIRHAHVKEDSEGTIRGTLNPSLDEEGEEQARDLAQWFENKPLSFVVTDDLDRTEQTAMPIANQQQLEIMRDIGLRSWDVGPDLEGRSIKANEDEIARLKLQPMRIPVGGQSWQDYEEQINDVFDRYSTMAFETPHPGALVLHGSGIQIIADRLGLQEKNPAYDATPVEPAGVFAVYLMRNGLRCRVLRGAKEVIDA